MNTIDLKSLSLKELEELEAKVKKAIANARQRATREARKAMEKIAAEFGISVEEAIAGEKTPAKAVKKRPAQKAPAKPKYRNPDNPSQTWSGHGRRPEWFKAALEAGKKPEDLEIRE